MNLTLSIKSFMPLSIIRHPSFICFAEFGWWFNHGPQGKSFLNEYTLSISQNPLTNCYPNYMDKKVCMIYSLKNITRTYVVGVNKCIFFFCNLQFAICIKIKINILQKHLTFTKCPNNRSGWCYLPLLYQ